MRKANFLLHHEFVIGAFVILQTFGVELDVGYASHGATRARRPLNGSTMGILQNFITVAAFAASLACAAPSFAWAEGPDAFRVVGIASGHSLVLRAGPDLLYPVAGAIPANATGVRNLGCKGGLTHLEWERASTRERAMNTERRWCRVRHGGVVGWAHAKFLREEGGDHEHPH